MEILKGKSNISKLFIYLKIKIKKLSKDIDNSHKSKKC